MSEESARCSVVGSNGSSDGHTIATIVKYLGDRCHGDRVGIHAEHIVLCLAACGESCACSGGIGDVGACRICESPPHNRHLHHCQRLVVFKNQTVIILGSHNRAHTHAIAYVIEDVLGRLRGDTECDKREQ